MIVSNVSIRTKSPELVEFFYPKYFKTSTYSPFIEGGVIFDGDSKYLQSFRDAGIPYIYIKGTPEYDLTVPENLLNFVFNKWDKKPSNRLIDYFNSFDKVNSELEEIAKVVWVTGKYTFDENEENEIEALYNVMARSPMYEIMLKFFKVSETMNADKLFYRIQKFIKMSRNVDSIKSIGTRRNAVSFVESRSKKNIDNALIEYLYSPADNIELKLLKMIDTLTVSER